MFLKIFNLFLIAYFVLTELRSGESIGDLRQRIHQIKADLSQLEESVDDVPELINAANLLRSNECLSKVNEKKTDLLSAYEQYSKALEELLLHVFEIQNDLKEILKEQSLMIPSKTKEKPRMKTKSKTSKK